MSDYFICGKCVDEKYIKKEIKEKGNIEECTFCSKIITCIKFSDFCEIIKKALDIHFELTPFGMTPLEERAHNNTEWNWEQLGTPIMDIITSEAGVDENIAKEVLTYLEDTYGEGDMYDLLVENESPFSEDAHYQERSVLDINIEPWEEKWNEFENIVKFEGRYLNPRCFEILDSLFGAVPDLRAAGKSTLIDEIGPGTDLTHLYRGRFFQSDTEIEEAIKDPDNKLGPPPAQYANAGRMNARGVSVFYGAVDEKTTINEIRPPVGSTVITAKFLIKKKMKVLDLSKLNEAVAPQGSYFDPKYLERVEIAAFFKVLEKKLNRTVLPSDEAFDYLPTQAIADYLAFNSKTPLDGIKYPSVQHAGGFNIAIFHKNASVESCPDNRSKEVIKAYANDGLFPIYMIYQYGHDELVKMKSGAEIKESILKLDGGMSIFEVKGIDIKVDAVIKMYKRNLDNDKWIF